MKKNSKFKIQKSKLGKGKFIEKIISLLKGLKLFFFMVPVFLLFVAGSLQFVTHRADAATGVNRTVNFQGKVVNKTDGTNITNGSYTFVFAIYDSSSGGTKLWGDETQSSVPVTNGIFQVALGSVRSFATDNLDFNQDNLWLQITFNGEAFGSRIRLAAVPYALTAEKVAGLTVTNNGGNTLNIAANKTLTASNSLTLAGTDGKTLTLSDSTTLGTNSITLAGGEVITFSASNAVTFTTSGTTSLTLPTSGTLAVLGANTFTGAQTIQSNSASALSVGANGATNPVLQIDSSTGSVATGLKIAGAATGGTTALTVIDSGSNANLSIDAKGTGTITIGGASTGAITLGHATTISTGGLTISSGDTTITSGNLVLGATTRITNAGIGTFASTTKVTGANSTYFEINNGTGFYRLYTDLTTQKDFSISDDSGNSKIYLAGNGPASLIPIDAVGVGPGNTTPHAALDVTGGTGGGNAALLVNQVGATTNDILTASASGTTKFTVANNGTLTLYGSTSGYSGFVAAATSPSLVYTLPSTAPALNGYVLSSQTNGTLSWAAIGACSTCLLQTPSSTATNTITVGNTSGVVGLTVNGTTNTTTADVVDINSLPSNAKVATNALLVNQNAGGTTTNGIQISQTTGTLTNGLTFSGTMTNLINSTNFVVTNGGAVTGGTYNGITISSGTGTLTLNAKTLNLSNSLTFAGTDTTTMTFPASNTTIAGLSIAQTFTNAQTITPTQNSVSALTVNGTSGTAATALNVTQSGAADGEDVNLTTSSTTTNGVLVFQNGSGTTTNGLQIQRNSGTLTNGLVFTGTISNDISTGTSGRALSITTNGAGAISINPGGSAGINIGTSNASGVTLATTSTTTTAQGTMVVGGSGNTFTFNPASGPSYAGTARPAKTIVLSAEYPGAILTASGSGNITGNMTSDASPSASTGYNWQNYYQWAGSSDTSPTLNTYTVAVRVALPKDFSAWASGNCMTVAFNTAFTSSALDALDIYIYKDADTSGIPVAFRTNQVSGTGKTWTVVNFTSADFGGTKTWNTAGGIAVIYLKMKSSNIPNYVQVGDITLNYLAAF